MTVLINDRVDLATGDESSRRPFASNSLPVPAVRDVVGSSHLIGVSVHSIEGVVQAESSGRRLCRLRADLRDAIETVIRTAARPGDA